MRGAINTHVTGRSTLDPLHREFLLVRIGTLCRSEYEYAAHVRIGRRAGMTDADLALILADPDDRASGEPLKLALLRATDELWADYRVADATWAELESSLSPEQMIDVLVAASAFSSDDAQDQTFQILAFWKMQADRMIGRLRELLENLRIASGIDGGARDDLLEQRGIDMARA